jgi:4-hydroxybenzoate polyprenyltransferase
MKGVPIASSVLHIAGGLIHFLLGYSLFRPLNWPSVWTGSFFALMFAAGHLTHEARDCDSDNLNGIQTNAVRFGAARNFVTGAILFTAADVLLFVLAANGVVPRVLMLVAAVYPLHLRWMIETWNAGPGFKTITRLQQRYRTLYAVMGVAMALATRI